MRDRKIANVLGCVNIGVGKQIAAHALKLALRLPVGFTLLTAGITSLACIPWVIANDFQAGITGFVGYLVQEILESPSILPEFPVSQLTAC